MLSAACPEDEALIGLLTDAEQAPADIRDHVESCAKCHALLSEAREMLRFAAEYGVFGQSPQEHVPTDVVQRIAGRANELFDKQFCRVNASVRVGRWCKRYPVVAGVSCAASIALLFTTAVFFYYTLRERALGQPLAESSRESRRERDQARRDRRSAELRLLEYELRQGISGQGLRQPRRTRLTRLANAPVVIDHEYEYKAEYLYWFARLCQGPEGEDGGDFAIGVLGRDVFGDHLTAIEGRTVRGRKIVIRRFPTIDAYENCQILFISQETAAGEDREMPEARLEAALERTKGSPVLLVSDSPRNGGRVEAEELARNGVAITFYIEENRLKIIINDDAATIREDAPQVERITISEDLRQLPIVSSIP